MRHRETADPRYRFDEDQIRAGKLEKPADFVADRSAGFYSRHDEFIRLSRSAANGRDPRGHAIGSRSHFGPAGRPAGLPPADETTTCRSLAQPNASAEGKDHMNSTAISEDVRLHLVESIAIVERHRADITTRMQAHLAALESEEESFGQAEITGMMLVDMLMRGASNLAACGATGDLSHVAGEHRRLDIDGRHYSRFGLALAPILREALGPTLPPRIVSAWCDAFWFTIRNIGQRDDLELQVRLNGTHAH